jgi:hypothetical protein
VIKKLELIQNKKAGSGIKINLGESESLIRVKGRTLKKKTEQLLTQVKKPIKNLIKDHRLNTGKAIQSLESNFSFAT